jgi:uncharacterized protein (TIGR00725 family)
MLVISGTGDDLEPHMRALAHDVGRLAIEAGFRIATGGRGGVMEAASAGARTAAAYREGDVLGILPGYDPGAANGFVDIAVPTGLGEARNVVLVALADVVVVLGGGAGTMSEVAMAWKLGKPIVAVRPSGGWAAELAGRAVDDRRADAIAAADSAAHAVDLATRLVAPTTAPTR